VARLRPKEYAEKVKLQRVEELKMEAAGKAEAAKAVIDPLKEEVNNKKRSLEAGAAKSATDGAAAGSSSSGPAAAGTDGEKTGSSPEKKHVKLEANAEGGANPSISALEGTAKELPWHNAKEHTAARAEVLSKVMH
jgi:hypothetical protein